MTNDCNHREVEYIHKTAGRFFTYRCIECNKIGESSHGSHGIYVANRLVRAKEGDVYQVFVRRELKCQ